MRHDCRFKAGSARKRVIKVRKGSSDVGTYCPLESCLGCERLRDAVFWTPEYGVGHTASQRILTQSKQAEYVTEVGWKG